jgi:hypothetical protein
MTSNGPCGVDVYVGWPTAQSNAMQEDRFSDAINISLPR